MARIMQCKQCNKTKEHKAKGLCHYCYGKSFDGARPEKVTERVLRHRLKTVYGIDVSDYLEMVKQQDNKCAICRNHETCKSRLSVDHCHLTKKVRGLLCMDCNLKIRALEDPDWVRQAKQYLKAARHEYQ